MMDIIFSVYNKHFYVDCTFIKPPKFTYSMYISVINNKSEFTYKAIFQYVLNNLIDDEIKKLLLQWIPKRTDKFNKTSIS